MDLINFVQTGGFPVKAERLQEMQTAYSIFNELGNLAGNLSILSGCIVAGTSVSDGYVYINGEVQKFKAGFISANVVIIQNESSKEFENGELKAVHYERYVTFGTADTSWAWDGFKRPDSLQVLMARMAVLEKKAAVFQAGGGMVLWNKPAADIPAGWAEVVDWRGRMPVGFDATQTEFNVMGKMNGNTKNKTLSIAELPEHDFKLFSIGEGAAGLTKTDVKPSESAVVNSYGTGWGNDSYVIRGSTTPATLGKSSKIGGGQAFSILNPYRVVLFIEYIG